MKVLLVILGIVVVAAIAFVAGCRILASRSTEATVALTAKLPGKIAVVYYSQSKVGNTATVAKWIAKHTGGELVPLETVEAYPDAYGETLKAAKKDMENGGTRAIKAVPPLDGYDVVFIGTPIWYGTYAPPVAEFFKTHSFAGKTVVPFCTHGGGGAGRYFVDVRKACPAATVKEELSIRGSNQVERRLGTGVTASYGRRRRQLAQRCFRRDSRFRDNGRRAGLPDGHVQDQGRQGRYDHGDQARQSAHPIRRA